MRRLINNIFFKWKATGLGMLMLSAFAMMISLDGYVYNDTLLIYLLPFFLYRLYAEVKDMQLKARWLLLAAAAGAAGAAFFNLGVVNTAHEAVSCIGGKTLIIGGAISLVSLYLFPFWEKMKEKGRKRKPVFELLEILGGSFFILSQIIQKEASAFSTGIWMTAVIVYSVERYGEKTEKRTAWIIRFFALIFSCCMTLGNMIHVSAFSGTTSIIKELALCVLGWYWIFKSFLGVLVELIKEVKIEEAKISSKKYFMVMFAIMLLGWLPYFLAFYPGVLSSDSISQVQQIMGLLPSSNHHPWIHTQLIGLCYQVGVGLFGTPNGGVAVYSVVSMVILAISFGAICTWQYKVGLSKRVRILSVIFLALCPFNGIYSITMWKDIPFTAFTILFMVNILSIDEADSCRWQEMLGYLGLSILVCLFRSNGIFVWLFTLPFFLWRTRRQLKRWTAASAVVLLLVMGYKSLLLPSMEVIQPDTIESLSIPAQQIACVIARGDTISLEAQEELSQIVDMELVAETYESHTSDPIKRLVRAKGNMSYIEENPGVFLRIYMETGINNIYAYAEAFIEQTKGYWYHKENEWIYHTAFITDNNIGISREGKLNQPVIKAMEVILELCLHGFHGVWSLALLTYLVLISIMFSLIYRKNISVYMPLIGLLLSLLIATPRYGDFRYVYLLFAALPLYLGCMAYSIGKEKRD